MADDDGQFAELDDGPRVRVRRRRAAELRAALGVTDKPNPTDQVRIRVAMPSAARGIVVRAS